jgi:small-conductance mechanosensitive channel
MMVDFSTIWQKLHEMANGLLALLPNLALALIVLAIFYYGGRWAKAAVAGLAHRYSEAPGVGLVIGRLTQLVVVITGAMIALSIVLPSFKASNLIQLPGISGVAIGFAFRDIFQNFLAGILLVLTHPFRIGDQIRAKDFEGTVEDIQTRATLIRTADGRRIVIPNADLFTESVTVNTAFGIRRSEYELALSHTEDVEQVRGALRETVSSVDGVLRDPQPDVLVTGFAAHSVKVRIRWWTAARRSNIAEIQDRVIIAVRQKLDHLKSAASETAPQAQEMLSQKAG